MEVVLRSARHEARAGNEGRNDLAVVGVFGAAGNRARRKSGIYAGADVGGDSERRVYRRTISRGGVRGVFPVCETRNGGSNERSQVGRRPRQSLRDSATKRNQGCKHLSGAG